LSFWENLTLFPQGIQRCFWISEVADGETRGNHAHLEESQVLVPVAGKVEVEIVGINGKVANFKLERNDQGLFFHL
jgi:dTDP-4-dehydrorhamnose 3,5-epimerase